MTELPPKALKVMALALNNAAPVGEWQNAAIAFVRILRDADFPPEFFEMKSAFRENRKTGNPPLPKVMPFGKFKGEKISDLPDWYLSWVMANLDLREPLLTAFIAETAWRASK